MGAVGRRMRRDLDCVGAVGRRTRGIWRLGVVGNLPRFRLRGCRGKEDERDLARGY